MQETLIHLELETHTFRVEVTRYTQPTGEITSRWVKLITAPTDHPYNTDAITLLAHSEEQLQQLIAALAQPALDEAIMAEAEARGEA